MGNKISYHRSEGCIVIERKWVHLCLCYHQWAVINISNCMLNDTSIRFLRNKIITRQKCMYV